MKLINTLKFVWINIILKIYVFSLSKEYIDRQIKLRKGECSQCGECCKFMDVFKCKFLSDDNKCLIQDNKPEKCKLFPIDEKHLEITGLKGVCSYHW